MTKTVYLYEPVTGVFAGVYDAQESPLEPGVYLAPVHSTTAAPLFDVATQSCRWDGAQWLVESIVQPPDAEPPEPPVLPKQFTSLEYLELFTETEQLGVVSATMANAVIKLWYDKMLAAGFITLADPRTEAGLNALLTAGLLTAERKAAIVEAMS